MPRGSGEWLEALAAEPDAEEWVVRAAYPEGQFDYDPEPWHGLYWEAWEQLRYDRTYGAMGGQGPIPYAVLTAYAAERNISGEDLWLFRTFMSVLDTEWLKQVTEREKRKEGSNGRRSQA